MFHQNKQKAIEAAKGEWILQLDADEALSDQLKKEIKNIIESNSETVAYYIPRKNWFLTKFLEKGGQYPDYTIRLYRNGYARFPCKDVHENVEIISKLQTEPDHALRDKTKNSKLKTKNIKTTNSNQEEIEESKNNLKTRIGYLKHPILHYADPNFERYLMRWNRYTSLEVENLKRLNIKKLSFFQYFFIKPIITFFSMYFRHKGFIDGFPGFVFSLFSAIRFWVIYVKWWSEKKLKVQS
jgi:glycosyltransferase involved in cell wall biosynthesis